MCALVATGQRTRTSYNEKEFARNMPIDFLMRVTIVITELAGVNLYCGGFWFSPEPVRNWYAKSTYPF